MACEKRDVLPFLILVLWGEIAITSAVGSSVQLAGADESRGAERRAG